MSGEHRAKGGDWLRDYCNRDQAKWTERAHAAVKAMLQLIEGDASDRDGLKLTPDRVVRSWFELYGGYLIEVPELFKTFEEPCSQMVVGRNIEFWSMCEHHMLPFYGVAHVAYVPSEGRVIGLSKMARLLDAYARRLQIQERIGRQVTEALDANLKPKGSACIIVAKHMCVCCRGAGKQQMEMVTSSLTGCFLEEGPARAELLALSGVGK